MYDSPKMQDYYIDEPVSGGASPVSGYESVAPTTPLSAPGAFTASPTPTQGNGAFGLVPGQLGLPDPYGNLAARLPGLGEANTAATSNVLAQLRGELPQDVLEQIQNNAARFGVQSGMPGSQFAGNRGLRDLGLTSLQVQQQGLGNLNSLATQTAATQVLNPQLAAQIAETNSQNAAAADPTKKASYAKSLFDQYLAATIPGGGSRSAPRPQQQTGGNSGYVPQQQPSIYPAQNILGGTTGYDSNGYPTASYAPGAFAGTNGNTMGNVKPATFGNYDAQGNYLPPPSGIPGPWEQTSWGNSALPAYAQDPYATKSNLPAYAQDPYNQTPSNNPFDYSNFLDGE